MLTLVDYLDRAKEITGSDRQTGLKLGVSRAAISKARRTGSMEVDNCVLLAQILDCDPAEVLACCHIARHPEAKRYWAKWLAASVILSVGIIAQTPEIAEFSASFAFAPLYIMRMCWYGFTLLAIVYLWREILLLRCRGSWLLKC